MVNPNDQLNLRDVIFSIVGCVRERGKAADEPRTVEDFLRSYLDGIDFADYETSVRVLQKMLSGNVSFASATVLAQSITREENRALLLRNLRPVAALLVQIDPQFYLFRSLQQKISLRFFSAEERDELLSLFEHEDFAVFLHLLLLHGFLNLHNLPCFFADRMYDEALTYDYDTPLRYSLMQMAADNGNRRAALEIGNYIAKNGPYNDAFFYLLEAFPLQAAVWNAAYLLEGHKIGNEQFQQFKAALKIDKKIQEEALAWIDELDSVICTEKNTQYYDELVYVYKVYFYLAHSGFYKAYNSLHKLLFTGPFSIAKNAKNSLEQLLKQYSTAAISGSNIPAMSNEASRRMKQCLRDREYAPESEEQSFMLELAEIAAEAKMLRPNYDLGRYYELACTCSPYPPKSMQEIEQYYLQAARLETEHEKLGGEIYYRLGNMEKSEKAKEMYYEQAVEAGCGDAAYRLALMTYEKYGEDQQMHRLLKAKRLIEDNIEAMHPEIRDVSTQLHAVLLKELNHLNSRAAGFSGFGF